MSSINLFGSKHENLKKKKDRREKKLKTTAAQEMYEFPPSYNAHEHPGIKITVGPHTTARGLKRRYRNKYHKKSKKYNKRSKKHYKKHHKKTQKRQ
jgi:hypothetical protein